MEMRDAFFKALYERARDDPSVIVLTGDQGAFWLDKIAQDMPTQFLNCGIAEQNMVSVAAGLALRGRRVFVHGINNFLILRALEQIAVDLVQHKANVVLVGCGAGYTYSTDGPTHHGVCDLAAALAVGLPVHNCSDRWNSAWFAKNVEGPAYVRIEKGELPDLYTDDKEFKDGSNILRWQKAAVVIASGYMVHEAMKLPGGVIDIQSFPIDGERLLTLMEGAQRVFVVEDNNHGPIAAAVAKITLEKNDAFRCAAPDDFLHEYGSREYLHRQAGL